MKEKCIPFVYKLSELVNSVEVFCNPGLAISNVTPTRCSIFNIRFVVQRWPNN